MQYLLTAALLAATTAATATATAAPAARLDVDGILSVNVTVTDLTKARAFYHDMLGFDEAFQTTRPDGSLLAIYYKVNDRQFVAVEPGRKANDLIAMRHAALRTERLEALRADLEARGLHPTPIHSAEDGNLVCSISDLPGQVFGHLDFEQEVPGSLTAKSAGLALSARRLSTELEHFGIIVTDYQAADDFYTKTLGFRNRYRRWDFEQTDVVLEQLRMPAPDIEFVELFNQTKLKGPLTRQRARGPIHFALRSPDEKATFAELTQRGAPPKRAEPRYAWDDRYNTNVFDADGTRVEFMSIEDPQRPTPLEVYTPKGAR
jgi:catechol 2,3-dioxygenase-like lactoylglutathione lyase family enzyme